MSLVIPGAIDRGHCSDCFFYERGIMQCRRHAPTTSVNSVYGYYPIVNEFNWCGDFEPAIDHTCTCKEVVISNTTPIEREVRKNPDCPIHSKNS